MNGDSLTSSDRRPVVRLERVSKYYPLRNLRKLKRGRTDGLNERIDPRLGLAALREISFSVAPGQAIAVIGQNGAGKTTLLRLLAGITQPTSGDLQTRGRMSALLTLKAGMTPRLTGRENVFLHGALMGFSQQDIEHRLNEIVAFSGLSHFIDAPVASYSPGMGARLGFATAIHLDADILLIDEILAVGDPAFQARALARMQQHFESGRTVIFASHNLGAVQSLCSEVLWLHEGELRASGPADPIVRDYRRFCARPRADRSGAGQEEAAAGSERSLNLYNALGRKRTRFAPGEPIHLRFSYTNISFAGGCLCVSLFDPIARRTVAKLEARSGPDGGELPAAGEVIAHLDNPDLPARQYWLEVTRQSGPDAQDAETLAKSAVMIYEPGDTEDRGEDVLTGGEIRVEPALQAAPPGDHR